VLAAAAAPLGERHAVRHIALDVQHRGDGGRAHTTETGNEPWTWRSHVRVLTVGDAGELHGTRIGVGGLEIEPDAATPTLRPGADATPPGWRTAPQDTGLPPRRAARTMGGLSP
jgi:hypothetical protein